MLPAVQILQNESSWVFPQVQKVQKAYISFLKRGPVISEGINSSVFSFTVTVQMVEKIILVWKQLEHA